VHAGCQILFNTDWKPYRCSGSAKKNHTGAEFFLFLSKLGRLEMKSREKKNKNKKKRKTNDDKKIKSKKRKDNKTLSQKSIEKT
jgi:hypothetical protein